MIKFKIGDRVKAIKEFDGKNNIVGKIGTVTYVSKEKNGALVI